MYKYSRIAATVMIALGLGLSACSQPVDTETSATESALPGMHSAVSAEGVTVTVDSAHTAKTVDMHPMSGVHDDIQPEESRDDGIFVVVETTVKNESGADMDLTCASTGGSVYAELENDQDAVYQPVRDLHRIPANPECNHNLGSGFDTPMTWVFQIPEDTVAKGFGFVLSDSEARKLTWISLDQLSDTAPVTTTVTSEEVEREPARASEEESVSKPEPTQPQQVIDTPVVPVPMPAPVPAAPAYGASCPVSMVQQPGRAADGSSLVCIYAGTDSPVWVYAPEPYGVGSAKPGGACDGYEAGGQDEAGRMMMCAGGQWIYGP